LTCQLGGYELGTQKNFIFLSTVPNFIYLFLILFFFPNAFASIYCRLRYFSGSHIFHIEGLLKVFTIPFEFSYHRSLLQVLITIISITTSISIVSKMYTTPGTTSVYEGSCHCGRVSFSVNLPRLAEQRIISCNCTSKSPVNSL
jgi:hypothetical protein